MTSSLPSVTPARLLPLTAGLLLTAVACGNESLPSQPIWPEAVLLPARHTSAALDSAIIYVTPRIQNAADVFGALRSSYPPALRTVGQTRSVLLELYVTPTGNGDNIHITESSGSTEVDAVALQVAHTATFTPALDHGAAEGSWWSWRITWPLIVIDGVAHPEAAHLDDVAGFSLRDVVTLEIVDGRDEIVTPYDDWAGHGLVLITTRNP